MLSPPRRQCLPLSTWLAPSDHSGLGSPVPPSRVNPRGTGLRQVFAEGPSRAGLLVSLSHCPHNPSHSPNSFHLFVVGLPLRTVCPGQVCLARHPFPGPRAQSDGVRGLAPSGHPLTPACGHHDVMCVPAQPPAMYGGPGSSSPPGGRAWSTLQCRADHEVPWGCRSAT